ncbi:hypothetical protein SAMN05216266_110204 [Amycolatopsis marina]|uniref:Uncharacterized protein n=1 Tax=Amycolatopsis marina TaxID=490629 RepID=A0A1I1AW67_9PSEU|nr:hypothetical protein [Amycolatopsis marina]SFB41782.1 hypothetical protein SAMN05216266_110204 [Amycolatopsis marina]
MQSERTRRFRSVGALLVLVLALTNGGCASWALSSGSTLDRAGEKVYSQVQVMSLVAEAAQREHPPTVSLQVMLDDAETVLSEKEEIVTEVPAQRQHRDELLGLVHRSQDILRSLRSAVDKREVGTLRSVRQELSSIAGRIEALGMT